MSKILVAATAPALLLAVLIGTPAVSGAGPHDVYQAIRANDLARLKALVGSKDDANAADPAGTTPLMYAATSGSVEAMSLLLDAGAGVNAQNTFGSTALIWSATQLPKVRLLLDHGANVNIAAKTGRTALFVAAMSEPSAAIAKMLIAKGADVKARDAFGNTMVNAAAVGNDLETLRIMVDAGVEVDAGGATGVTPLIFASYHGNLAAVKLLLSKGANVNAVARQPATFPVEPPRSGPIALGRITPLLAAIPSHPEVAKALLDAGADVNAKDVRNMTPLMIAVATDYQDPALIRLLLERGADASARSGAAETARDWARKTGAPHALELLKVERPQPAHAPAPGTAARVDARTAAQRSLALLESSSQKFFDSSGCVSCHHQSATDLAAAEARAKGLIVNADAAVARMKMLQAAPPPQLLLERMDLGVPEIFASVMAGLAAAGAPPNPATDFLVANIAASQASDGSWHLLNGVGDRPPTSVGHITRVALCIRALEVYGPPGRGAEMAARIAKARAWLSAAKAVTAEDANMQLLGLHWAGAAPGDLKPLAARILGDQQDDGGWRQHEGLGTDAYATGQSLYVLAKAGGLPPSDPAYARGVRYLLATQGDTGAWRVASRSPKFQAYFNSNFPYSGDQWISAWATAWSTMALVQTLPAGQGLH